MKQLTRRWLTIAMIITMVAWGRHAMAAAGPVFSDTGPDATAYGAALGYPVRVGAPLLSQLFMVGNYSHYDTLWPSRVVAKPAVPSSVRRATEELKLSYRFQGANHTLDDYLKRNPVTGLLIAHDDTILFEHYRYARTDRDRLTSQSMAKTITCMLLGIAVSEGAVRSIDDPAAKYVPELAGTEYGKTPIRALLHMSSGIAFSEVYDGADDNFRLGRMLFGGTAPADKAVAMFNHRDVSPGTRFHYASIESEVLGLVISHAVHMTLASYLEIRIWQPMGAQSDASWVIDNTGQEIAYCCFNATLRDWARFALMLAHDGAWNGRQIIPRQWLLDATSVQAPYLASHVATPNFGYGYQVWLLPGPHRQFALLGTHGQAIFVDPWLHLVLVQTAVRLEASSDPSVAELIALWRVLVARYGG